MEFFLPGLFIFFAAIMITFFLAPKVTPIIAAIISIVFLTYGVYDHYQLFASEYKLSTWQDGLKIYAPFLMIGFILLFIIYSMVGFFTTGSIPIPSMPEMPEMPQMPNIYNIPSQVSNSLTNVANSISNTANDLFTNTGNNSSLSNIGTSIGNSLGFNRNNRTNRNGITRSYAEVI
jgi:hypothetical protein